MAFPMPSNTKAQGDQAMSDQMMVHNDNTGVLGALKVLSGKIETIRRPTGADRKSPARTCLDLYLAAQEVGQLLDNGLYWVDPNQGCEADAIEVYCDFTNFSERVETCVHPTQAKIAKDAHTSVYTGAHQWWSNMGQGMPISYDPPKEARVPRADYASQITFLRLLATRARQTVSYHCKNGQADLKLRGTGESEFDAAHPDFVMLSDSCDGSSSWNKAVMQIDTKATARMPIKDIATLDAGNSGQQFGFDIGPVCFS
jgi:collagen type I/II/III/V/XI/XXIV/XXVII alpha